MDNALRLKTIKLINNLLHPLVNEGLIRVNEEHIISPNLRQLTTHGELMPPIAPKLIDQKEAADMLSFGLSNFKRLNRRKPSPSNAVWSAAVSVTGKSI